jgi:type IV pilus assembly protein PilE
MRGVTLIELLIVVVVISILAAFAYPSYQEQVQRARRADGKGALLNTAQRLERCYTRFSRYDSPSCDVALPLNSPEANYVISAVGAIEASRFTLAATPSGVQTADTHCGVLRLASTGQQGSQDSSTDANSCW